MTDNEKLKKLFEAALKDVAVDRKPLARAFPDAPRESYTVPPLSPRPAAPVETAAPLVPAPAPIAPMPHSPAESISREEDPSPPATTDVPHENVGLDAATSAELGVLIDERREDQARRRRRGMILTMAVFLGLLGSAYGWVASSPERMKALSEAITDIRSAGDVAAMVAKFQTSLDRVATRGQHIDQARSALGVEAGPEDKKDPYLQEEMKEMTGKDDGKSLGERNQMMTRNFDHMREKLEREKTTKAALASNQPKTAHSPNTPVAASTTPVAPSSKAPENAAFDWDTAPVPGKK